MVRWMVALCLLCLASVAAAAELRIELPTAGQPYPAELGRAFSLQLSYLGEADLGRISLEAWQQDFALDRGYVREENERQYLRVRLTPRRTGLLSLTPLQLGPARSEALAILSSAALEADEHLDPAWQVSHRQVWQGQEVSVSLMLDSHDPTLRLETAEARWPGFQARALPPDTRAVGDGRFRHRFGWLLRARQPGSVMLQAPELRLLRDGVPVRRFHFPGTRLVVEALPDYLPPTLPIGTLALTTDADGGAWLIGKGIPGERLQSALDRARLPTLGILETQDPLGTLSKARLDWSRADIRRARLVYFDPALGRLRQLTVDAPGLPLLVWLLPVPFVLMFLLLAWRGRRAQRYLHRLRARRHLLERLANTADPGVLNAALLTGGTSLQQWQRRWRSVYRTPGEFEPALQRFEACCYGGQQADAALLGALREVIARSRARW